MGQVESCTTDSRPTCLFQCGTMGHDDDLYQVTDYLTPEERNLDLYI